MKNFLKNLPQPIQELSFAVDRFNAKTACLSKGLEVFGQHSQVNKSKRYVRVARGVHGFHLVASEGWVDNLLYIVQSTIVSNDMIIPAREFVEKMNETYGCDHNRENTSGRLSEHLQYITTSLAPYPRLLSGVLGALGTSSDKKNDAQNQELHQGSLARLLQHYQVGIILFFFTYHNQLLGVGSDPRD